MESFNMSGVSSYGDALNKASLAHSRGHFADFVALLDPFREIVENDEVGGLLLAIALTRTARGDLAYLLSDRLLGNGRAGPELLQLRVLIEQSRGNEAAAQRALKAVLVFAPGDKGGTTKQARSAHHGSQDDVTIWFKRAYCLGANDFDVVQALVLHLTSDVVSDRARAAILDRVDEDFCVLWLRHASKSGLLREFRFHCPPAGNPLWRKPGRRDLEESRDLLDLFVRLNDVFREGPAPRDEAEPRVLAGANTLFTAMVDSLVAAERVTSPFSHLILRDIFPAEYYRALVERSRAAEVNWGTGRYPERGVVVERVVSRKCWKLYSGVISG
jgi:hypothetical protein